MSPEVIAFVHAKGTSERVPNKNVQPLGDKPLFCHAVDNACRARFVDQVVIDSDDRTILETGERHGAVPLERPEHLATNRSTGDDLAYWQASNYPQSAIVIQVVPTSPFISPATIDRAVTALRESEVDSVVGVFGEALYQWDKDRGPIYFREDGSIPNSSEMDPVIYETTGLYANRTSAVLRLKKRMNVDKVAPLFLSRLEAVDINTPDDLEFARLIFSGLMASR